MSLRSRTASVAEATGLTRPNTTLAVLCGATFMVLLDNSIVNVALPSMQQDLGFTSSGVQWVIIGYALPFGGFLLVGGRLGDLFGTRRIFMTGMVVFAVASMVGGLALSPGMLVAARVAQGLGAAALSPSAMALVIGLFPAGAARNRALGVYATTATLGITVGMVLGGVLTGLGGWRWVMFITAPVALAALALAPSVIPHRPPTSPRPPVDLAGAVTVTVGLVGLLYALERVTHEGWADAGVLFALLSGITLLVLFVVSQLKVRAPLLPLTVLGEPTIRSTAVVMLMKSTMGIAALFLPTVYFQEVLGYSPLESGLAFVPAGVASTAASLTGPRLVQRLGSPRVMIVLALSLQIAGLLLMSAMPSGRSPLPMIIGIAIVLVGFLWTDVALNLALSVAVSDTTRGAGTGLIRTAAQLGGAIGLGVIATLVTAYAPGTFTGNAAPDVLTDGLRLGLWCGAVFAAIGIAVALTGLRERLVPGKNGNGGNAT